MIYKLTGSCERNWNILLSYVCPFTNSFQLLKNTNLDLVPKWLTALFRLAVEFCEIEIHEARNDLWSGFHLNFDINRTLFRHHCLFPLNFTTQIEFSLIPGRSEMCEWVTITRDFNAQKQVAKKILWRKSEIVSTFSPSLCIKCVMGVSSCSTGFNQIKNALFMDLMKIYMLCLEMVGTKGRLYLIWRLEGPGRMENIYKHNQCLLAFKSSLTRAYKEWRPTMQFNADLKAQKLCPASHWLSAFTAYNWRITEEITQWLQR